MPWFTIVTTCIFIVLTVDNTLFSCNFDNELVCFVSLFFFSINFLWFTLSCWPICASDHNDSRVPQGEKVCQFACRKTNALFSPSILASSIDPWNDYLKCLNKLNNLDRGVKHLDWGVNHLDWFVKHINWGVKRLHWVVIHFHWIVKHLDWSVKHDYTTSFTIKLKHMVIVCVCCNKNTQNCLLFKTTAYFFYNCLFYILWCQKKYALCWKLIYMCSKTCIYWLSMDQRNVIEMKQNV